MLDGTLTIESMESSVGPSVRTSFRADGASGISFACWVKEKDLSGNIRAQVNSTKPENPESCMLGYPVFDRDVARVLREKKRPELNTFGIGE
jgi:hypothetical protein